MRFGHFRGLSSDEQNMSDIGEKRVFTYTPNMDTRNLLRQDIDEFLKFEVLTFLFTFSYFFLLFHDYRIRDASFWGYQKNWIMKQIHFTSCKETRTKS